MKNIYLFKSIILNLIALCILLINDTQAHLNTIHTEIDISRPHSTDCTKFIKTDRENIYILSCAPGTTFDIEHKLCDFEKKVDCSDREYTRKTANEDEKSNIVCSNGDTGFHSYPNDCTKYIECAQGQLYKKDCANGTVFNTNLRICDHKYNFQCEWNVTVSNAAFHILCPKNITGLFAYPFHFGKYINCTNGQTWVQNCASNYKFNTSQRNCTAAADIENTDFVKYYLPFNDILVYETLFRCPHNGQFYHLYPFDAGKFIKCTNFQLEVVSCGPSKVFSIIRQVCLQQDQVLNSDRVPLLSELPTVNPSYDYENDAKVADIIFCSLDLFGLYPHPFDNSKYLKCAYGRLFSHSCRAGYVFSLSRRFCDMKRVDWSFDSLPPIQYDYEVESKIEIRLNDSLIYLKCPFGLNGTFVYPFDCTKYLICSQGLMRIRSCQNNDIYSIWHKECKPAINAKDYAHVECVTNDENDFANDDFYHGVSCLSTGTSKHPHPQDWHKYVQCDDGQISIQQCPRNHIFSLTTHQCVEETVEMDFN